MHPDLQGMIALQRVDNELRRLRDELDQLPRQVAALAALCARAQAHVLALYEQSAAEEKLRRAQESDISSHQSRLLRLRRQLDAATTAAQISALEHEIGFAGTEIRRLEDEELASMERTEKLSAERAAAAADNAAAESRLETDRLRSADQIREDQAAMVRLEEERSGLRSTIGEDSRTTYDRVRRVRGTAVAEGVAGKCSACQMAMRPQRWHDLRDRLDDTSLITCESCGRFLFWDPARDAPVPSLGGGQA